MTSILLLRRKRKLDLSFSADALPAIASFSRASAGTRFNASGSLESIANDLPRFDYDPVTLASKGLLIEPQRTNYVRNNSMVGAATTQTLPTNWSWAASMTGITRSVAGVGTENSVPYIDLRWVGTATSGSLSALAFEYGTQIAAVLGDVFTNSFWYKLVGGSLAGVSNIACRIQENNSSGGYLASGNTAITPTSNFQQVVGTKTMSNASTAYVLPLLVLSFSLGVPADLTLRLYALQMEKASSGSSLILTTTSNATRAADVLSFTIPAGVSALRYVFDDNSTQDISVSAGAYTVPTNLNRPNIKRIFSL